MSDSVFPALMAVLIGVAASAVLFIPFVTLSYRHRGRPGGGQDAAVGRGADLLLGALVVPRRHRGMAPTQDAGGPRPVTRGGRLLAMLCDWLGFTLVSVSVSVSVQLIPVHRVGVVAVRGGVHRPRVRDAARQRPPRPGQWAGTRRRTATLESRQDLRHRPDDLPGGLLHCIR